MDLEWFGRPQDQPNIQTDYNKLTVEFLSAYDAVILLAGHSSVAMCKNSMLASQKNNVRNFCELLDKLEALSHKKSIKFIYASSASVYGSTHKEFSVESTHFFQPHNYYDLSKQEIDYYAALSKQVEYYGLRFCTVNGWSPHMRNDLMLNAMYQSARVSGRIVCFNKDCYRPLLAITDLAAAVVEILQQGSAEKKGIYNLLSFNSTIGDIAERAAHFLKCELAFKETTDGNTYSFSASHQKFSEAFGFEFRGNVENILESFLVHAEPSIQGTRGELRSYE